MENIIIIAVLILLVGAAVLYLLHAKKKGVTCVGCPHASACASAKNGSCSCKSEQ